MSEKQPSEAVVRAWTRLLRAQQTALSAIEGELKAAGLPALEWYDVLLELSRAEPPGLRPSALEARLLLAQYNLSRLLDRMVKAGYVRRVPVPEDARGHYLEITDAGRTLMQQVWPVYRAGIARHVGDKLTKAEAQQLGDLLERLLAR